MRGKLLSIVLLVLLGGCGGGGGGDQGSGTIGWDGPLNLAGYPAVAGDYSLVPGEVSYSCSDGTKGKFAGEIMHLQLLQLDDELEAFNLDETIDPDLTIVDLTELTGFIETDGRFTMAQTIVYELAGHAGRFTVEHDLAGTFKVSGWSGEHWYTIGNDATARTCSYSSRFSGELLESSGTTSVQAQSVADSAGTAAEPAGKLLGHGH
jgi:hypothetical protein